MSDKKNDDNNNTRIIIVTNCHQCFTQDLELFTVTRAPLILMDTTHTESIKIIIDFSKDHSFGLEKTP